MSGHRRSRPERDDPPASGSATSASPASGSRLSEGRRGSLLRVEGFTAPHGFSTRLGGYSSGAYASLNLRASTGDDPEIVKRNQELFAGWFGVTPGRVATLEQVHGTRVVEAKAGESQEADAQVSGDPGLLLVIGAADCLPLLFHHPESGVVAAAHCGWRGTVAGLAGETVRVMAHGYGCEPGQLEVALGPGICSSCYQVGAEVRDEVLDAGLPEELTKPDEQGRWRLDLAAANRHVLMQAGVAPGAISSVGSCTSCEPDLFYSHRRDRGVTGRHWAAVRATSAP